MPSKIVFSGESFKRKEKTSQIPGEFDDLVLIECKFQGDREHPQKQQGENS